MTLNWKPRFKSFLSICEVMLSKPTWLRGKTVAVWDIFVVVKEEMKWKERGRAAECLELEVLFRGKGGVFLALAAVTLIHGLRRSDFRFTKLHRTPTQNQSTIPGAMLISRVPLLVSIRTFFSPLSLSALTIPAAIQLNIPSPLSKIFESILRAVPKKKQSHARRRMRQLAGKALKGVLALNTCPVCGGIKRHHVLCEHCVGAIKDMWKQERGTVIS